MTLYDSEDTLFYCDPPYLHETRGDSKAYGFEMDVEEHRNFASVANSCSGKVAVSGYEHPLMDDLLPPDKWHRNVAPEKTIHSTKGVRQEIMWTNYKMTQEEGLL